MTRTEGVVAISDVNRKAYRRQLHRLVRWLGSHRPGCSRNLSASSVRRNCADTPDATALIIFGLARGCTHTVRASVGVGCTPTVSFTWLAAGVSHQSVFFRLRCSLAAWHHHLTRHKISDREPTATRHAAKLWMAKAQKVSRRLARGSLHRLVRCVPSYHHLTRRSVKPSPKSIFSPSIATILSR